MILQKENSIKKNYFYNVIAKLFLLLIPIVVTPFLARRLEPTGSGALSFVASIVSYFILAANIGIETYGQRLIATHQKDLAFHKKAILEIFILRFILTIISLIAFYLTFCVILKENVIIYALYGITLLATAIDFRWFFQGIEKFNIIAISSVIANIIYVPLVVILVQSKEDLWLACLLQVLSTVLPYFLCIPVLIKYFKNIKMEGKINPFKHFRPCMVYFIPTIAIQIYTVLDKTMIGLITHSDAENGYYEYAEKLVKLPLTVITSLNIIMRSRISYHYSLNEFDKIDNLVIKSARFTLGASIPITLGLAAITYTFVPLYLGDEYEKCIPLLYILSPLIVIIGLSNLYGNNYYIPFDKQRVSNIFLIIGSIVNVIFNSFLIFLLESIGAAIASVIAETVISALYIIFARKFFSPLKLLKISINYLIAGGGMFVVVYFMNRYLDSNVWYLILEIGVGALIYGLILLILRDKLVLGVIDYIKNKLRKNKELVE